MNKPKVLITGATGFLGKLLTVTLHNKNYPLQIAIRKNAYDKSIPTYLIPSIDQYTQWLDALINIDCVIHCAARVHIMNDGSSNPLDEFREINTFGTLNLAKQAAVAGVKRFIYISSIKVNGEYTLTGKPFMASDLHNPQDPYGVSKSEGEQRLLELGKETGMEIVIIRPPLVYGPGVKANFASLLNMVSKGLPLPFGCITNNKRSLVSVFNLVDLILTCIEHPDAANQVFLVSDDNDVSTASMVQEMSHALDVPSRSLRVPLWCYRLIGKIFGKKDVVNRLLGSLQVDITHTKETLSWSPPQTMEQGFKETAEAFLKNKEK